MKKIIIMTMLVIVFSTTVHAHDYLHIDLCTINIVDYLYISMSFYCDDYLYIIDQHTDIFSYGYSVDGNICGVSILPQNFMGIYGDEGVHWPVILRRINNKDKYILTVDINTILSKISDDQVDIEKIDLLKIKIMLETFYSDEVDDYQYKLPGNNNFKDKIIFSGEIVIKKVESPWKRSWKVVEINQKS